MNREELIEEAAKAIARSRGNFLDGEQDRISARAALAVFEKAQAPTDDEREALSNFLFSVYEHGSQPNALREADAILSFLASIRLTQSEPTDVQVEAAAKAYWPAYSAAVRNTRPDPKFGITPAQGHKCTAAGMRAALRAAFTAGQEDKP